MGSARWSICAVARKGRPRKMHVPHKSDPVNKRTQLDVPQLLPRAVLLSCGIWQSQPLKPYRSGVQNREEPAVHGRRCPRTAWTRAPRPFAKRNGGQTRLASACGAAPTASKINVSPDYSCSAASIRLPTLERSQVCVGAACSGLVFCPRRRVTSLFATTRHANTSRMRSLPCTGTS